MADQTSNVVSAAEMKSLVREDEDQQQDVNGSKVETESASRRIDISSPAFAIRRGFHHFKTTEFDVHPEYFQELAEGQNPKFLVFACSDSRVGPSRILNFKPGQAFTARNIANLVPGFNQLRYSGVGAVIEYAVEYLEVENILVIGHSRCGGIRALMELPEDGTTSNDFIDDWIKIGLPAKEKVQAKFGDEPLDEQIIKCEREAVNLSLENLLTYPYVKERVAKGTLKLMGGRYDFVIGNLELWDTNFRPLF